ncbi:MAG: hypothetical protein NTZ09_05510 [Candidatus Hydrogenedentes bacterium]|nr:hypothetical protein [Candidatus Hydrogenedentota bacterium]
MPPRLVVLGPILLLFGFVFAAAAQTAPHRVYPWLMDSRQHPDYARRHVQPPSWEIFGNATQFVALRGFTVENDEIKNYVEELDKYTKTFKLGNVVWPSYPIIFAKNLGDLADEIQRRGLFLFDLWGYVPGSGAGGYWQQYKPPAAALQLLEEKLGDHWLGMDVGEQDGRYIGGYASQVYPISDDRREQYLNFQRHFQRICDDLGNRMSVLVSLNYGHYMLKEGVYSLIGAETAQALPNSQVYYAFIRGAGKQYGVPWFGNASVWNRWGYKTYGAPGPDNGPTKGTSLSLLKRLLYSHILYNSVFVGFESSWFDGPDLSPVGKIQQAAQQWVRDNGEPGVMHAPVALMLDFFAGWTFPRHLYTSDVYRVWGNIPYNMGDYLTDNLIDLIYPGYQDASYYHDERGFISPTPYGDIADCLLSDAPRWVLDQYPMIILAGGITPTAELFDNLRGYVENGGCLVATAGNLRYGITGAPLAVGNPIHFDKEQAQAVGETEPFSLVSLEFRDDARILASIKDIPAVVEVKVGKGRVIAIASEWGLTNTGPSGPIHAVVDAPLEKPYHMPNFMRAELDQLLREQMLFEVGDGLSLVTCRRSAGEYTLGVCNNALEPRPFKIVSHCGPIETIRELPLDQSEKSAVGYMPEGFETSALGQSSETTIAGGNVRIFRVNVREENVVETRRPVPPAPPKGRLLPLRGQRAVKEEILLRPTFFQHFDGVVVDWRYLRDREADALKQEAGWLRIQNVRVWVDLTSGINLFPDLRLVNNDPEEFAASLAAIDNVLAKMPLLNADNLILSLHRMPETNFTAEQTRASFIVTLKQICGKAAAANTTVHLRMSPKDGRSLNDILQLISEVAVPNLRVAPSVALLLEKGADPSNAPADLKEKIGVWLVSGLHRDSIGGAVWSANAPAGGQADPEQLRAWLCLNPKVPVIFDAVYVNQDDEYKDAKLLAE